MKVSLIRPQTSKDFISVKPIYDSSPPPLGLVCIASYIKEEADVRVYDANLVDPDLDADIVGIQDWVTTHEEALKLAKEQNPNSIVVLGGVNASHLAERILTNHKEVDYVIQGHGEEAFSKLISGEAVSDIPNLCYREGDIVKKNKRRMLKSPLFNLEQVVEWESDSQTPFPIAGIRGCIKAAREGVCEYCSLDNQKVAIVNPNEYWQQIRILKEMYGISFFFKTGDEFVVGKYPNRLLEARPKDLEDVSFRIYTYPDSLLKEGIIETLSALNVREAYMGIETINESILEKSGRTYNSQAIEQIFKQLQGRGIKVMLPFMFGLPGETNETAQVNFDFSQRLLERYPDLIEMMQYSLVVPIVGSSYFDKASLDCEIRDSYNKEGKNIDKDDSFDYNLLTDLFIERFSEVDIDFLKKLIESGKSIVKDLGVLTSTFIGIED